MTIVRTYLYRLQIDFAVLSVEHRNEKNFLFDNHMIWHNARDTDESVLWDCVYIAAVVWMKRNGIWEVLFLRAPMA